MSAGFTPGPWIALDTGEVFACETDGVFASDRQICSTVAQDGYEEEQANARLIAAAPELFVAGHNLAETVRVVLETPAASLPTAMLRTFLLAMNEALAKARGEA